MIRHGRAIYRTRRWRALRLAVIERDGGCCRECGSRRRLEVHHVKRIKDHPEAAFDPASLKTLCSVCHARQTRHEVTGKVEDPERAQWRAAVREIERQKAC